MPAPHETFVAPFDATVAESTSDGVYFVDTSRQILFWNKAAERISGHQASHVVGSRCFENILRHVDADGHELCFSGCPLAATIVDARPREADVFLHHPAGHRRPVRVRTEAVRDGAGRVIGAIELFTDGGELARTEERLHELERLALNDTLTAIGNRRFLEMSLTSRFEELTRYGWPFGVLMIDFDKFKRINDTYGHDVGDRMLQMVAATLTHCSRATDSVGRWGGDEFLIVLANATDEVLRVVSERIRALVERSTLSTPKGEIHATVSIGGALAVPDRSVEDLLRLADKRVYTAKTQGRNRVMMAAA
jgi:diguanylate cyclase (GGDEF)-like protein/PAS domain S-box-containing protein